MPEKLPNKDIEFQPKTDGYSFSTEKPYNPKSFLNTFLTLVGGTFVFAFIFLLFLGILNYFNIISLNSYAPKIARKLPKITPAPLPAYDIQNQTYTINGRLMGYDYYQIKVKYYNQVISFNINPTESKILLQNENNQRYGLLYDLEMEKNIGKQVNVTYSQTNKINSIQLIILYE